MNRFAGLFLALLVVSCGPVAAMSREEALVSTQWLAEHLDDPALSLIEVSVNDGQFARGHIPGAVEVRWHVELVDPVQRDIASRESVQALLRRAGARNGGTVVLYGDNHNWFAAWGAWVLEVQGLPGVRLLDGGREKWESEGRPLVRETATKIPGDLVLGPPDPALRAFLPDVVAVARGGVEADMVDVRSPDEFSGALFAPPGMNETALRAGHVPGAVNVPWSRLLAEDGTFLPAEALRRLYAEAGVDGTRPVITYCRIGERASHSWFALHRLLGYRVRNYDGSWTEYGNAVGVPIVNPAGSVWQGR